MSNHEQTTYAMTEPGPEPRNEVKVGYLVTGVVFLGLVGIWGLRQSDAIGDVTVGWMAPALLVAAGLVGLLAMVASGRRRKRPARAAGPGPADPADSTSTDDTEEIR